MKISWYIFFQFSFGTLYLFTLLCHTLTHLEYSWSTLEYIGFGERRQIKVGKCKGIGRSTTTTGSYNLGSNTMDQLNSTSNIPIAGSLETGRIERGETSKQKFKEVDMDFDNYHISSVVLEMLPESRKPVELKMKKKSEIYSDTLKREGSEVIELIKKLSDLHSAGILTDEEFSEKKKELLSKI